MEEMRVTATAGAGRAHMWSRCISSGTGWEEGPIQTHADKRNLKSNMHCLLTLILLDQRYYISFQKNIFILISRWISIETLSFLKKKSKKYMGIDKLLLTNKRECEVNIFSPSCSVWIEFSFPAVPLAQLRNHGSCSIVCQLDWGPSDPGLHLMSVRKQHNTCLIIMEFTGA